jgi:hypothetical protein
MADERTPGQVAYDVFMRYVLGDLSEFAVRAQATPKVREAWEVAARAVRDNQRVECRELLETAVNAFESGHQSIEGTTVWCHGQVTRDWLQRAKEVMDGNE